MNSGELYQLANTPESLISYYSNIKFKKCKNGDVVLVIETKKDNIFCLVFFENNFYKIEKYYLIKI